MTVLDSRSHRELWEVRMRRFRDGELTAKAFCEAEGVSQPSFYYWKRKLADATPPSPGFVSVSIDPPPQAMMLKLPGGATIDISPSLTSDRLAGLIAAVVAGTTQAAETSA